LASVAPTASHANIAMCSHRSSLSITIKTPLQHPLLLSCRCVIHHRQVAIAPSIVIHHRCARSLLPLRSRRSSSSIPVLAIEPSIAVDHRPASITDVLSIAAALSISVKPSIAVLPSIAVSHLPGCCVDSCHADASRPPVEEFPYGMFNIFLMRGTIH
jgi:hypothetical protein